MDCFACFRIAMGPKYTLNSINRGLSHIAVSDNVIKTRQQHILSLSITNIVVSHTKNYTENG